MSIAHRSSGPQRGPRAFPRGLPVSATGKETQGQIRHYHERSTVFLERYLADKIATWPLRLAVSNVVGQLRVALYSVCKNALNPRPL